MFLILWSASFLVFSCTFGEAKSTKKGICVSTNYYRCDDLKSFNGVHWWNDWSLQPGYLKKTSCTNKPSQEHVPMVWGWWRGTNITGKIPESEYLIGFNEPNHKEQSNMSPAAAAKYWKEIMKSAGDRKLVSPSAAPCGNPAKCLGNVFEWFDEFFKLCKGCKFDYISTHHYSCNPKNTISYLKKMYERYHYPIWLTEFSCPQTNDATKILQYMKGVLPLLEKADYVFRYSWFTHRRGIVSKYVTSATSLVKQDSSELTELGKFYNEYQP